MTAGELLFWLGAVNSSVRERATGLFLPQPAIFNRNNSKFIPYSYILR